MIANRGQGPTLVDAPGIPGRALSTLASAKADGSPDDRRRDAEEERWPLGSGSIQRGDLENRLSSRDRYHPGPETFGHLGVVAAGAGRVGRILYNSPLKPRDLTRRGASKIVKSHADLREALEKLRCSDFFSREFFSKCKHRQLSSPGASTEGKNVRKANRLALAAGVAVAILWAAPARAQEEGATAQPVPNAPPAPAAPVKPDGTLSRAIFGEGLEKNEDLPLRLGRGERDLFRQRQQRHLAGRLLQFG